MKRYLNMTILVVISLFVLLLVGCSASNKTENSKTKEEYVELELPNEMFYHDLNYGEEFDKVCKLIEQPDNDEELLDYYELGAEKSTFFLYDDTLYCRKQDKELLEEYYQTKTNYDWFIEFETDDNTTRYPIDITEDEKEALYSMEEKEREDTLFLNDVEIMATLLQVSKDNIVCGKINLLYYNNIWYWQTEIINEDEMKNDYYVEYVHALPDTVIYKINEFL